MNAQTVEQHGYLGFSIIAVHLGEFDLDLTAAEAVRFREIGPGIDLFPLGHQPVETLVSHDDRMEDRFFVKGEMVLPQYCDPLADAYRDFSLVRFHFAGENVEKGGFSGAVGADEAVTVAGGEFNIYVLENDPLSVGEGDIGCVDHFYLPVWVCVLTPACGGRATYCVWLASIRAS